jgi:hypothetical protein
MHVAVNPTVHMLFREAFQCAREPGSNRIILEARRRTQFRWSMVCRNNHFLARLFGLYCVVLEPELCTYVERARIP